MEYKRKVIELETSHQNRPDCQFVAFTMPKENSSPVRRYKQRRAIIQRILKLWALVVALSIFSAARAATMPPVREFDAMILSANPADGSFTIQNNPTQFAVTLTSDANTVFQRTREATFADLPVGAKMRFWGVLAANNSSMQVGGIRRAAGDDNDTPTIVRGTPQDYVAGTLIFQNNKYYIFGFPQFGLIEIKQNAYVQVIFEEQSGLADLQPGRRCHARYQETAQGGLAQYIQLQLTLPRDQSLTPASGATPEQVQQTFAEIEQVDQNIEPQLAHLMPVKITVSPELAKIGEPVTFHIEALAVKTPNGVLDFYPDFFVNGTSTSQPLSLAWQTAGQHDGLTVYQADCPLPAAATGSTLVHWKCDIGGDTSDFWRYFAVIDDSWAVAMFMSTSHASPRPAADFHRLQIPYEEWVGSCLNVGAVLQGNPQTWAGWSQESRQYGMKINPMLYSSSWMNGPTQNPYANMQSETPETQRAILDGYREMLPWLGFGPVDIISAYTMDNSFSLGARDAGFKTISSLCSGQNFMDGPMRINHLGMPERPYFISPEDFRKPGPGGPQGLVGVSQCQRNSFLCREFNCTYSFDPSCDVSILDGGGRSIWDDLWMSRMYDYFDAMLQNRLSQNTPYFFNVGIQFNGTGPGITEANRMLIEYAAKRAKTEPLAFATGPAVTEYYRRHFTQTPETTCYQQDYFCGLTAYDKYAGYPDTLEIEGPDFQSLCRAPEILPVYHYDYQTTWTYPAWGNEDLPRNQWGYLYPGTYDPYQVVPKILDTRLFQASRADTAADDGLTITMTVQAQADQKNLVLALWDIPRGWRAGTGWWSVAGQARFVPVRAPFSANLNGLLVADVKTGENKFSVTLKTPARDLIPSTIHVGDAIEGRVLERDGQTMAYFWPTKPWGATLVVNLLSGWGATAYMAPEGNAQPCALGQNTFAIPAGAWMRLIGLTTAQLEVAVGNRKNGADPIWLKQ